MTTLRSVEAVVTSTRTIEGGGFVVRRPFPTAQLDHFDPFLLLDHLGPVDYLPGSAVGAPAHPHRGFETVTYMIAGKSRHKDSAGNAGTLGPGDVQWMTAGAGVVHDESPDPEMLATGGRMEGLQLWVNLPRADKMIRPRYQEIPSLRLPTASTPDGGVHVKVIAGESMGARAVIETRTPITYLHFTLAPGARFEQPAPAIQNTLAYVLSGRGAFGAAPREAGPDQAVFFAMDGDTIRLANAGTEPLSVLVIGGVPLNEPIARYGPFVMNTEQEIHQAVRDYQAGRMGEIRDE